MLLGKPTNPLLVRLGTDFDRLFGDFIEELAPNGVERAQTRNPAPALTVTEAENGYRVQAEVPGVSREDLDIEVHEDELRIRGERKEPEPVSGEVLTHRNERVFGKFERIVRLPTKVNSAKVEAALENGVLTLTLPVHESTKPRKIALSE